MYVFLGQVLKSTFIVCLNFILFNFLLFLELERILKEKLDNEIPVITVVSVMGTTEESAVDPLTEILELRKQFRTKVCHVSTPLQYLIVKEFPFSAFLFIHQAFLSSLFSRVD